MFNIYQHVRRPQYRLILREWTTFPAEAYQVDWVHRLLVDSVGPEVEADIRARGYCLYQIVATFAEVEQGPSRRDKPPTSAGRTRLPNRFLRPPRL
jgi:hypothetical protein